MSNAMPTVADKGVHEIFMFRAGEAACGIEVRSIQEVRKDFRVTPVPQAPAHVKGVMNLRGDIATVFDLPLRIGLDPVESDTESRIIVVKFRRGEHLGLLVSRIEDVILVPVAEIRPTPAHLTRIDHALVRGVYQKDDDLVAILDLEAILKP